MTHEQWLQEHDLEYALRNAGLFEANVDMQAAGLSRLPTDNLLLMVGDTCRYWMKKRKSLAKRDDLTAKAWDRLQDVLQDISDRMGDMTLTKGEVLELVRCYLHCNENILDNVQKRYQIWSGSEKKLAAPELPEALIS